MCLISIDSYMVIIYTICLYSISLPCGLTTSIKSDAENSKIFHLGTYRPTYFDGITLRLKIKIFLPCRDLEQVSPFRERKRKKEKKEEKGKHTLLSTY